MIRLHPSLRHTGMGKELGGERRGKAEPDHLAYKGATRHPACLYGRNELPQLWFAQIIPCPKFVRFRDRRHASRYQFGRSHSTLSQPLNLALSWRDIPE